MPQYLLGLKGMTRRMYTYPLGFGWHGLNVISTLGAYVMGAAFVVLVYNVVWSMRHGERDVTGDPWDGRTLEWALPSPAPEYNFARIPVVSARDAWWDMKQKGQSFANSLTAADIRTLEMPKNSALPFLIGLAFFVLGFGMTFEWWIIAAMGFIGVVTCILRWAFDYDGHKHIHADEIRRIETQLGRLQA